MRKANRDRDRKGEKEIGEGPSDGKRDYQKPLSKGNATWLLNKCGTANLMKHYHISWWTDNINRLKEKNYIHTEKAIDNI